jgi:alanine-glyoxylate transaminase/(R)-3-amino-2-methylpropionate-pyruvate transaminase
MPEISYVPPEYKGLSFEEVKEKRLKFLSPSLSTFQAFKTPFYNTRGKMQYLWDADGNRYLDLLAQNLTISCGHNHPTIVEAVKKQIDTLCHSTTMYYNESNALCAEALVATFPKGHDWVVHFVNSGSEAVDLAVMQARAYTRNFDFISLRNSYHGLQGNAQATTGVSVCKQNIPLNFGFFHTMNPDTYRGPFAGQTDMAKKYAGELKALIETSTSGQIAGFMYEQVQGYGGIYPLPKGYVSECIKHVKAAGGLVIADEVQTGFGRSGDKFWSFELEDGVVPDIVVMAKGLGNGFPIAAVVSKREIAQSITNRQFFNTYGGNPTMCAAGRAVLKTIKEEKLQENSKIVGDAFLQSCLRLQKKYPIIGDVRAQGLMLGLDIVKDPKSKEPDTVKALDIFEEMRDNGVVLGKSGRAGNVLRILPPMCVNLQDVKFTEQVFDYVLGLPKYKVTSL